jgi:starch synthase
MLSAIVTREWPPEIYGGAGVHVAELVKSLQQIMQVDVTCMGSDRTDARAFPLPTQDFANAALAVLDANIAMANAISELSPSVVHSHTWYANFAGHTAARLLDVPHIVTAHSLEPRRPWKADQLGGGYRVSSWIESETYRGAEAIIAVSSGMKEDVLSCYPFLDPQNVHVIHNGIDAKTFVPTQDDAVLEKFGIDTSRPYVLFVGRITRQKGLIHLLNAAKYFEAGVQLVLAASSPDEKSIGDEVEAAIVALRHMRPHDVVWIDHHVAKSELIVLLSGATVFACPSIYEPLGIVNLEAMACETAVVASAVGGIPEVVHDGVTGTLIEYTPANLPAFERSLAHAVNDLVGNRDRAAAFGVAGRRRAVEHFDWNAIALQTRATYRMAMA